jgi:hypothetical protein
MFKGFSDSSRNNEFHGFPNLNFQMNNEAYGFSGCTFWLDAAYGLNTQTDLAAVSSWKEKINGLEFIQQTAGSQPRLNIANAVYNNLPVVHFFDANRFMVSNNTALLGNYTIAIVANYDILISLNCVVSNSIGNFGISLGGTITGANGVNIVNGSTVILSGTTEDTSVKIVVLTKNNLFVNGIDEAPNHGVIYAESIDQIGRYINAGTGSRLRGKIAEVIVWDNNFNSDMCLALSDRINSKYAIY